MPLQLSHASLFSISPNPYMVLNRDLVYVDANDAYLRVTGRRREEVIGRHIFDAFPGDPDDPQDSAAVLRQSLRHALDRGETHHLPLIRYSIARQVDGREVVEERFWSATHVPVRNAEGAVVAVLQHTVDVTELQTLKQAMRASRTMELEKGILERAREVAASNAMLDAQHRHLRRLFEQAPGFIAVLRGPLHVFDLVNESYRQLIGHRDVVGKTVRQALPEVEGQGFFELLDRVYASGEPYVGRSIRVLLQRTPDAPPEERWIDLVYQPVLEDDGSVSGILAQGHDMTEQHQAQEEMRRYRTQLEQLLSERTQDLLQSRAEHEQTRAQLEHVQKLEALGRLTGGIAHDFNNLLQVLNNSLLLLKRVTQGNEPAQRWIATAGNAVSSGAKLTGQLLAFARKQPLEPRALNIGRLLQGMDDLLRRSLGGAVEVETVIAGGLWNTHADPTQLENVILNLAINARDAMDGEGRLTIEARNAMLDDLYADTHHEVAPGQYVLLAVSDTGCGMPPDVIERAFEPFFSTKPANQGTGLGLSMVYGFVKQSGGHVKIYSEPGHGTTVKIYLPRSHQAEEQPELRVTGPVEGGTETVLVVEDDPAVLATTVETLDDLGYRVLKASDGQSALAIVNSGVPIDLLFTDVVMPGPVRSVDLARQAQQALPQLKVLFTSGYTENAIVHGGRLDPGVNLISKPYRREDLARKIRQVLQQGAGAAAAQPAQLDVLFVEDDAELRHLGVELLRLLGHRVMAVGSAEEALAQMAAPPGHPRHAGQPGGSGEPGERGGSGETGPASPPGGSDAPPREPRRFDVLLTDVALPGLSGVELAREARARQPGIRVILASGYGRSALPEAEQAGDRTLLLPKPYSADGLKEALARVARAVR
ncbi:MAG: PAS domain-containing protein [Aquabacterium sp.]|nr:PAS domain-containing protein [Aquabacterium sp.]